jgi:hypothetical protein
LDLSLLAQGQNGHALPLPLGISVYQHFFHVLHCHDRPLLQSGRALALAFTHFASFYSSFSFFAPLQAKLQAKFLRPI